MTHYFSPELFNYIIKSSYSSNINKEICLFTVAYWRLEASSKRL